MAHKRRKKKRIPTTREHPPFAPVNNRPPGERPPVEVTRAGFRPAGSIPYATEHPSGPRRGSDPPAAEVLRGATKVLTTMRPATIL